MAENSRSTLTLFCFVFWPCCTAQGISAPEPRMEPLLPEVEAWSLNHWTVREVPQINSNFISVIQSFITMSSGSYCYYIEINCK